ncbi:hypothetical protein KCP76_19560 [Salmonella enterica subsp. enterica serovar Weltevreden]|nr:hypothetical protein KCP76_19560 [Salmonella enterica subsp. enterica serovar Weltevreden]
MKKRAEGQPVQLYDPVNWREFRWWRGTGVSSMNPMQTSAWYLRTKAPPISGKNILLDALQTSPFSAGLLAGSAVNLRCPPCATALSDYCAPWVWGFSSPRQVREGAEYKYV